MKLNKEQIAIMRHTADRAANGLYCGDSPDMQVLVKAGLMEFMGRKSFVPDPYFRLTGKGRAELKIESASPRHSREGGNPDPHNHLLRVKR